MANPPGVTLYQSYREHLELLTDAQLGFLVRALLSYAAGEEVPPLDPASQMAFSFIRAGYDRDSENYRKTCEKNRANGSSGKRSLATACDGMRTGAIVSDGMRTGGNRNRNRNINSIPPVSPPGGEAEESKASSGESLTVEKAGGAAETADHSKTWMDESFNRFWAKYPRKVAKQEARKAWNCLKPDEGLLSRILAALDTQRQSDQWARDNGRYIPHAASWLRGKRWEDDTALPQAVGKRSYAGYDLDLAQKMIELENDG